MKETLTIEEFRKLPREEKNIRYQELSDHDKFLARVEDRKHRKIRFLLIGKHLKMNLRKVGKNLLIRWKLLYRKEKVKENDRTQVIEILSEQELICKGWFLPSNTYDCGSFVVN